jgi:hypothetical protein
MASSPGGWHDPGRPGRRLCGIGTALPQGQPGSRQFRQFGIGGQQPGLFLPKVEELPGQSLWVGGGGIVHALEDTTKRRLPASLSHRNKRLAHTNEYE